MCIYHDQTTTSLRYTSVHLFCYVLPCVGVPCRSTCRIRNGTQHIINKMVERKIYSIEMREMSTNNNNNNHRKMKKVKCSFEYILFKLSLVYWFNYEAIQDGCDMLYLLICYARQTTSLGINKKREVSNNVSRYYCTPHRSSKGFYPSTHVACRYRSVYVDNWFDDW